MGDFGMKAAQKGYNIDTAADYQLLFSSAWPTLKIHSQGSFTISDTSQDTVITSHNLGYPPMWLLYEPNPYDTTSNTSSLAALGDSVGIDEQNLTYFGSLNYFPGGSGPSLKVYYYIFRQSMLENFTAPLNQATPAVPVINNDYGIKISKQGKSITSTDFRDYVVHSSARNLQIHKTINMNTNSTGKIFISHGLSYQPLFFLYGQVNGQTAGTSSATNYWKLEQGFSAQAPGDLTSYADTNFVYVTYSPWNQTGGNIFLCIFKDPFILTE